ncbi:MAG: BON domain-containing protein [Pseudobdellovibrio sp.]
MKTDSQIQNDVIQALKQEPGVGHEHIGVTTADGVVTLFGSISSYLEKSNAEKATQQVEGVLAIVEKIEVSLPGSYMRADHDIAKAIIEKLKSNTEIHPSVLVKVCIEEGWVTLYGTADWEYQRTAAENCVRCLSGVVGVSNAISVKDKIVQPSAIKKKIELALKAEAERDARQITVEVDGDKVILAGKVRSTTEKQDAQLAVASLSGVKTVQNDIVVS